MILKRKTMDSFKSQLQNDFIPFIKDMIEKENEHFDYLNKKKIEYEKMYNSWLNFFYLLKKSDYEYIDDQIIYSTKMLSHLKERLEEYIIYHNNL